MTRSYDVDRRLERLRRAEKVVADQIEDEGLWFEAETAPEAYLQAELRRLHWVIENTKPKGGE